MASASFSSVVEKYELLYTDKPGSFANLSYRERIPNLLAATAENNKDRLTTSQYDRLHKLATDMRHNGRIPLPSELYDENESKIPSASQYWTSILSGKNFTWQNAPWFLSELYAFHMVLVFSGYYTNGVDPFHPSKKAELAEVAPWKLLLKALHDIELHEKSTKSCSALLRRSSLQRLMKVCMWGNKADGCYTVVKDTISGATASLAVDDELLLIDHTEAVVNHLEQRSQTPTSPRHVQFINDNCGTELLLDLALVDHLLTREWCERVTLNVKAEPMYISDATEHDVQEHIESMCSPDHPTEIQELGNRLLAYRSEGKLVVKSNTFWNQYTFYWEMPNDLKAQFSQDTTTLVILKGDLNYRRLLGDRLWPASTPVDHAVPYFPTAFVSLRTLKSDPIVGVDIEMVKTLDREDWAWRFNGKRGIIQSVIKPSLSES